MKKSELVSIVIPCYNQAQYVKETVESVLDQTYPNIEISIVNDGSTDESEKIVKEIIHQYPDKNIRLINQSNKGLSEARNSGIRASSGDYLFLLDSDDKLHNTMVSKCMDALMVQDVDITYADYQRFGEETSVQKTGDKIELYSLLHANVTGATALYRKSVWEKTGGYKQNMSGGYEDWEFWINATKNGFKFYHVPEVLFYYRVKKESMYTDAYNKDAYLRAKIVMNHPELYTPEQADKAMHVVKETEKLPELYFLITNERQLDDQQIRTYLGDYLANHTLLEKQTFTAKDKNIGLCALDTFENMASIEILSKEMDTEQILFYAPLRYKVPPLQCLDIAWSHAEGFVPAKGNVFEYVARSTREDVEIKLQSYQRSERFLREKCHILEHSMGQYSQLYLNLGYGYNETDSIKHPIHQHSQPQTFTFALANYANLTDLRLDPLNDSCMIEIEELKILRSDHTELDLLPRISTNDCNNHGKSYYFETMDPNINFEGLQAENLQGATQLIATIRYTHIDINALEASLSQIILTKDKQIKYQAQQIQILQDELGRIYTSRGWRYIKLVQNIKKLTKIKK
jgi:glycosyltransferase involved in cell wall biosynthesis